MSAKEPERLLAQRAYEIFSELTGISAQHGKGDVNAPRVLGAMPWAKVPPHIRKRWEVFTARLVAEVRAEYVREASARFEKFLKLKGATLGDVRIKRRRP